MPFSFEVHSSANDFETGVQGLDSDTSGNQQDDQEGVVLGEEQGFSLSEYKGLFEEEEFIALGINPSKPTEAKPGSDNKVLMLAARYATGLPLWHESDCYDHGPGEFNLEV